MTGQFKTRKSPPKAVSDYLGTKGLKPGFDWDTVWQEEHATAFTVAKLTELTVLNDVHKSLKDALDNGTPFKTWAKDIKNTLEKKGWTGEREVTNPDTGEVRTTNLTSPRRLRTIFDTNMRSARAAGQWDRAQRTKRALPFFLYQLGPSERHRPHHQAKEGVILPVDDPFWQAWFPPNGWGCKCWLRQISAREAERRGYTNGPAPETPPRSYRRKATGEVEIVPEGIDPGFAWSPGRGREENVNRFLSRGLDAAPMAMVDSALADMARWPSFNKFVDEAHDKITARQIASDYAYDDLSDRDNPSLNYRSDITPIAKLPDDVRQKIGKISGIIGLSELGVARSHTGFTKQMSWLDIHKALKTADIWGHEKVLRVFWKNETGHYRLVLQREAAEFEAVSFERMHPDDYAESLQRAKDWGGNLLQGTE